MANSKGDSNNNQKKQSNSERYMSARKREYAIIAISIVVVVIAVVVVAFVFGMKSKTPTTTIKLLDENGNFIQDYKSNDAVIINPGKKQGYIFSGWVDENGVIYNTPKEAEEAGVTSLKKKWDPLELKLKLYTNGGVIEGDDSYQLQKAEDEKGEYYLKIFTIETETFLLPEGNATADVVVKKDNHSFVQWSRTPNSTDVSTRQFKIEKGQVNKEYEYFAIWQINKFSVAFNTSGGTQIPSAVGYIGTPIEKPADPEREGYIFEGWNQTIPETIPAGNLVITARWKPIVYTISYDSMIEGATPLNSQDLEFGSNYTFPEVEKIGHSLEGWYLEDTYENKVTADTKISTAKDHILYAKWTINQYTITFDSNGGSAVEPITKDYASAITAPANPERKGYTFTGWSPAIPSVMPAENKTLTAQWTINQYTITFINSNDKTIFAAITQDFGSKINWSTSPEKYGCYFDGYDKDIPETMPAYDSVITINWIVLYKTIKFATNCSVIVPDIIEEVGKSIVDKKPADPEREGYTFNGWSPTIPEKMPAENMEITAKWEAIQYTISYDLKYTTGETIADKQVTYDEAYGDLAAPTRTGYNFVGWYLDEEYTNVVTADTKVSTAKDHTLYAKWTAIQYTISYNLQYTTEETIADKQVTYDKAYGDLAAPTRTGYDFVGWYLETTCENVVTSDIIVSTAENHTLYAKWTINQYTITFDSNGGSAVNSITQDYASNITAPADPERDGYTFNGWSPTIPATMPAENMEITAKWEAKQYTISYDLNYGTEPVVVEQKVLEFDSNYVFPNEELVTRTGYDFVGWYLETTCENVVTSDTKVSIADNHTLYAKWEAIQYSITYINVTPFEISIEKSYYTIEEVPQLTTPTNNGEYTFDAWYINEELTEMVPEYAEGMHENITVYGNWYSTGLEFNTEKGTVSHTGSTYQENYYIPKVYQGVRITTISTGAYLRATNIKKVDMRYIEKVGINAFMNSTLETIVISKELTNIDMFAFGGIDALTLEIVTSEEEFNMENITIDNTLNENDAFIKATKEYINQ